jgi:hypothetical protein
MSSVEDTLKQRGSVYGEFTNQVHTIAMIIDAMKFAYLQTHNQESPHDTLIAEWHYLAIKLARIAANPMYLDSYHDLAGYATLMEEERSRHGKSTKIQ